jgi:hypothetical protein
MDVIILGIYNMSDKENLNKLVSLINGLDIVWNFEHYNIDAAKGISIMKKYYNLLDVGIVIDKNDEDEFSTYPLKYEISNFYISKEYYPLFFVFLDKLENIQFDNNLIMAFADEWEENTPVKIEKIKINEIKNRINSIFVWCESYTNLISNTEIRDDFHPLILEVEPQITP